MATQAAHCAEVILVRQLMEKYAWQSPHQAHDEQKPPYSLFER